MRRSTAVGSLLYLLALAAIVVRLPVVATPFSSEDREQLDYLLERDEEAPHPYAFTGWWDLYRFLDGNAAAAEARIAAGSLPWRTDPQQKVAFWRPVAAVTMVLDAVLFGRAALPAHLHSFLWFLVLAASLLVFYRRVLPEGAAAVAWLAFLVSPASIQALSWWAARNALVATVFAIWFLRFHLDWFASGRRDRLLVSLACLALCLLSAEAGVAVLAFVGCHAAVQAGGGESRRVARILPSLLLAAGWIAGRGALGYGIARSALYVDPLREPLEVAGLALDRLPRALGGTLLNLMTGGRFVLIALALLIALVVAYLRSPERDRSALVWLGAATLIALLPAFTSRNALRPWSVLVPQIGAHAVLGLVIARAWSGAPRRAGAHWRSVLGILTSVLAVVCLLVPFGGHIAAAGTSLAMRRNASADRLVAEFPATTRGVLAAGAERMIFLRSPYRIMTPNRLMGWHEVDLGPSPGATLVVSDRLASAAGTRLARLDVHTVELRSAEPLLRQDDLFRFDRQYPLRPGETVHGDGFVITVGEMSGTATHVLRVTLDRSWDDPGVVALAWDGEAFRVVEPPPVGDSIELVG